MGTVFPHLRRQSAIGRLEGAAAALPELQTQRTGVEPNQGVHSAAVARRRRADRLPPTHRHPQHHLSGHQRSIKPRRYRHLQRRWCVAVGPPWNRVPCEINVKGFPGAGSPLITKFDEIGRFTDVPLWMNRRPGLSDGRARVVAARRRAQGTGRRRVRPGFDQHGNGHQRFPWWQRLQPGPVFQVRPFSFNDRFISHGNLLRMISRIPSSSERLFLMVY